MSEIEWHSRVIRSIGNANSYSLQLQIEELFDIKISTTEMDNLIKALEFLKSIEGFQSNEMDMLLSHLYATKQLKDNKERTLFPPLL